MKAYEKPAAPSELTAIHKADRIMLSWSYPENLKTAIKGFHVLRSEGNGFERMAFIEPSDHLFIESRFRTGVEYKYKVIAENLKGVISDDSNVLVFVPQPLPPPPQNIRFEIKNDVLGLSWESSGRDICYNIYRTTEKGKFPEDHINVAPVCTTFYKDTANPDSAVYYRITPLLYTGIINEGHPSQDVEINPGHFVPSQPSDLRIAIGDDKVYLIWEESPEPWVRGYNIYRKREGEAEFRLIGESRTPAFTDSDKAQVKTTYMIQAIGPSAESRPLIGEVIPTNRE